MEDGVEGISCISGEQVSSRGRAVSVENSFSPSVQQTGEFWDDLLGVLMWPIYVVGSYDDDGQFVGLVVRVHYHLCGGLGGRIRVRRSEKSSLEQIISVGLYFAVYLVRRYVDESFHTGVLGTLEQHVRT